MNYLGKRQWTERVELIRLVSDWFVWIMATATVNIIGAYEAKMKLPELLARAEAGAQ